MADGSMNQQPNMAPQLIITFDSATNVIVWDMSGPMPLPRLVFTLEKIKLQLLADDVKKQMEMAQQKQQGSLIIPPGGKVPGLKL